MEEKYGIIKEIKEKPKFPIRDLLRVPHQGGSLIVSWPAFGGNYFSKNIKEMQKTYLHPESKKKISFREPTTAESISASAYRFADLAKPEIFNPAWLQAGRIVKTSEGVFANPPKDKQGNSVIDEKILKQYLNLAEKINGIYIVPNKTVMGLRDFGFAPYGSFEQGVQSGEDFAVNLKTNGLARILEHTKGKVALKLKSISSKQNYSEGVNVYNFEPISEPVLRVSALGDDWYFGGLDVGGEGDFDSDLAFGVLEQGLVRVL